MKDPIMKKFSGIEVEKRKKINLLMQDWRNAIPSIKIKFADDNKNYPAKDYFAGDGFFPSYYSQKIKVLFIGREARWMTVLGYNDYIATFMLEFFQKNNDHNQRQFTRHLLYIVEGIKSNGSLKFEEVKRKTANGIAKEMVSSNDYGYAMMNISKYSNDSKGGDVANVKLINSFLEHSSLEKRNFFQEELAILDPDVIITGNLWDGKIEHKYLDFCFGEKKKIKEIRGKAIVYETKVLRKKIKLIDLYAFSSRYSDKEYFYDPIMKLLFHGA
jgi:hypothetical protein